MRRKKCAFIKFYMKFNKLGIDGAVIETGLQIFNNSFANYPPPKLLRQSHAYTIYVSNTLTECSLHKKKTKNLIAYWDQKLCQCKV